MFESLKFLDLFGIFFTFRMTNYNLFQSKTGTYISIIVLVFCVFLSYETVLDFFDCTKNYTEVNFEKFIQENHGVDFESQLMNLGFILNNNLKNSKNQDHSFLKIKAFHKLSSSLENKGFKRKFEVINSIDEIECDNSNFKEDDKIIPIHDMRCLNFTKQHTLKGSYSKNIFSEIEIIFYRNKSIEMANNTSLDIDMLYPIIRFDGLKHFEDRKTEISGINTLVNTNIYKFEKTFYIKKMNYTYSSNIFKYFGEEKKETNIFLEMDKIEPDFYFSESDLKSYYVNREEEYNEEENKDLFELGKFKFRLQASEKIILKTRKNLITLSESITSIFINTIISLGFFFRLINLKKGKKNIIERCFLIIEDDEETKNIQNIELNNKNLSKSNSINPNSENFEENLNSQNSEIIETCNRKDSKELYRVDSENNLNDKLNKKENKKKKNKVTREFYFRRFIWNIITCNCRKLYQAGKIFKKAEMKFNDYLYIKTYVDKMREIEFLKKYVFNSDEERIFTHGTKPIFRKKKYSSSNLLSKKIEDDTNEEINEIYRNYCTNEQRKDKLIDIVKEYFEMTKN